MDGQKIQWASEIGILNESWPILITTFKRVPPGTNGGVSQLGLLASFGGGATIGLSAAITLALEQPCHGFAYEILFVGAAAGLIGSLVMVSQSRVQPAQSPNLILRIRPSFV